MIHDKLTNSHAHDEVISARLKKGLAFLKETDFSSILDGKHNLDGENLFYIVERYTTKKGDDCTFEAHQKYIDIQYVVNGRETIGFAPQQELDVIIGYCSENEVELYHTPKDYKNIDVSAGEFCILYPEDGHMPQIATEQPEPILKVVIKVLSS